MFKDIRGMPICDENFGDETLAPEYAGISPGGFAPVGWKGGMQDG